MVRIVFTVLGVSDYSIKVHGQVVPRVSENFDFSFATFRRGFLFILFGLLNMSNHKLNKN